MSVSVMILTLNEETNIVACLKSLAWSNDIVVFDSYSSDKTVSIAKEFGCRVEQRKFDNWSSHQNWAVQNIKFKHPWVLYMDADERCPDQLAKEVQEVGRKNSDISAYRIRRKDFFMGHWLKHAQLYPTWLVRLFQPQKIQYERLVNPIAVVDGETAELSSHIHHYPFSHGIAHWIARHNRYSDMEAEELIKTVRSRSVHYKNLFSRNPNIRRKVLKEIFFRLPARPFIKFAYYYFLRRGFLDGRAGLTYSILQSIYEYFIQIKVSEIRLKNSETSL